MKLNPTTEVFVTCAVTGSGDTIGRSSHVPVTPEQIANATIGAARAGAAIAHIHVRDPVTGAPSRDIGLYQDVVSRIKESGVDIILNLTGGMGGDAVFGPPDSPLPLLADGTDLVGATERMAHIEALRPEICTIDCGSVNFGSGGMVMVNTPDTILQMARHAQQLGVRPELEIFELGHLRLAEWLVQQGAVDDPVLVQLCTGIPWGIPDDLNSFMALKNNVPPSWTFSAFSIGRGQLPFAALALIAGGNIRVGLEDNLWLEKGVLASNEMLVERAVTIAKSLNSRVMGPAEVRERLKLVKRW